MRLAKAGGSLASEFKICSGCGKTWVNRDVFLGDPETLLVGYQVHFEDLKAGLFLFNHTKPECQTTLALTAGEFMDLYDGPIFAGRGDGAVECSGQCLHHDDLRPCPIRCECTFVREVIQVVRQWPKRAA